MPRRRALTEAQLDALLALPADEADLIRHWTLDAADRAAVDRRRGATTSSASPCSFARSATPAGCCGPARPSPTPPCDSSPTKCMWTPPPWPPTPPDPRPGESSSMRLREEFGFRMFGPGHGRDMLAWLLPVALATTSAAAIAAALMDELRRRRIVAPGPSVVERLIAAVLVVAERHVADQLTKGLSTAQVDALDALLRPKEGTATSVLAWARQPPGAPGHRALARIVEQLACLREVGLKPAIAEGVHPERLRKLAREGARFTAQHLRACRRCAAGPPWSPPCWTRRSG